MEIIKLKCPSCKAPVDTDLEKSRKYTCNYCRSTFYLKHNKENLPNNLDNCILVDIEEALEDAGIDSDVLGDNFFGSSIIINGEQVQMSPEAKSKFLKIFFAVFISIFVLVFIIIISTFIFMF